ncbi:MAG: ABC transporter substrate-binding protein [Nitrospina sp.]|nr:ABC transporter substrate-binding protein [Nitrospina sp.]
MHMVVISLMINLTVVSVCFAGSEITNKLKNTVNKVISTLKDEALKNDLPARRAILRNTINDQFNYRQMVMRSLAKNWDVRSAEEQQLFIALFKSLLENSYANKLESFSNEKINYLDEVVKGEYALVKTEVVRKATTVGVDYKLVRENGVWQVYDFVIEGVSMVRNYRAQFTKIIHKHSYEVLVQKLTDKINALKKGSSAPGDL